jgi:hypothetical protein
MVSPLIKRIVSNKLLRNPPGAHMLQIAKRMRGSISENQICLHNVAGKDIDVSSPDPSCSVVLTNTATRASDSPHLDPSSRLLVIPSAYDYVDFEFVNIERRTL